jgi:hypothetical protein
MHISQKKKKKEDRTAQRQAIHSLCPQEEVIHPSIPSGQKAKAGVTE